MRLAQVALLCSIGVASAPTLAATLSVRPLWQGPAASPPAELRVKVYPATAQGEWKAVLDEPVRSSVSKVLPVPEGEYWISLVAPDAWAESARVRVEAAGASVEMKLWPGGIVEGRMVLPPHEKMPKEIKARFAPAPGIKGPSGLERCVVGEEGSFRCKVPAFKLDLRFRAEGFITHYRWDFAVPRGGTSQAGRLPLIPGASVVGWVATEDGSPLPAGTKITLEPAGTASPLASASTPRTELLRQQVVANDRGFFHLDGISPGAYAVSAAMGPMLSESVSAQVLARVEAELSGPLLLARPEALSVQINPPLDPWDEPWRALLLRSDARLQRGERVRQEFVPADGFLKLEGLARGSYLLQVLGPGSAWAVRQVELGKEAMPVEIDIKALRVVGRVTLDEEPLAATIWFGGRTGGVQAELKSNEEGRFEGMIPRPGDWRVEIEAAEPKLKVVLGKIPVQPKPGEGVAEVHLALPDTLLRLAVKYEDGRPEARATVTVEGLAGGGALTMVQERVGAQGFVDLPGLAEGSYLVSASGGPNLKSDELKIDLDEDRAESRRELILRQQSRLNVRVVSSGAPVPGAAVLLYPASALAGGGRIEQASASGELEVALPPATARIVAIVSSPGLPFLMGEYPVPPAGELTLTLPPQGGSLRLKAPVPSDHVQARAVVVHGGTALPLGVLRSLNREVVSSGVLGAEISIPNINPGPYSLCSMGPDGLPAAGGECTSGALAPNGTLELELR